MPEALVDANCRAIHLLEEIRDEYETDQTPVVISGCLGPRGNGYVPARAILCKFQDYQSANHWEIYVATQTSKQGLRFYTAWTKADSQEKLQ